MEKALEVLELKSTLRGLVGAIVAKVFWAIVFLTAGVFILDWARKMMMQIEALTREGRRYVLSPNKVDAQFLYIFAFIFLALAIGFFIAAFIDLYKAREVNQVFLKEGRIVSTAFGFPFRKVVREIQFNRILRTDVSQGNFDRLLGTGTLDLVLITFTNADSRRTDWDISHIADPESAQAAIMAAMPAYEGLEVKVAKD